MKKIFYLFSLISFLLSLVLVPTIRADYVLPYPSYMPGNKMHAISRVADKLKGYWHWGNIASFRYHLGLSDKYLVEAKTLFEYKQYLLASDALKRSDDNFELLPHYLKSAKNQGKDVKNLVVNASEATEVHVGMLGEVGARVPEEFIWQPEKTASTVLPLGRSIREAINLRQTVGEIIENL